ncbi:unnamed protein product, partial [Ranitomeya imitator]
MGDELLCHCSYLGPEFKDAAGEGPEEGTETQRGGSRGEGLYPGLYISGAVFPGLKGHDQYSYWVLKVHDQYSLVLKVHDQYSLVLKCQPPIGSSIHPRSVSPNEWLGEKDFTEACEHSLSQMENSHKQLLSELQRHHEWEIQRLRQEKDQLLAEETAATASVIDAIRAAHKEELQREVEKARTFQHGGSSTNEMIRRQHQSDMEALRRELQTLSERYSQKCLEIGALNQAASERDRELQKYQQEVKELLRQNQASVVVTTVVDPEKTKILAHKRAQKSGPGSVPHPLAFQSLSVGGDEDVHQLQGRLISSTFLRDLFKMSNSKGGRSRPPTSSSSALVTYFACSSCNSKLPS